MKHSWLLGVLVIVAACSNPKQENTSTETPVGEITVTEVDSVPNGYMVTEDVYWLLKDEKEGHFDKAKEKHMKADFKTASDEISKAVLYINQEIEQAADDTEKQRLSAVRDKLTDLANRLVKGEKVTDIELRESFYAANVALYRNYLSKQNKSVEAYNVEKKAVSTYLDAALNTVEHAEKWSDKKFDDKERQVIAEGKTVSQNMKNASADKSTFQKDWEAFRQKLKELDDKLEGSQAY
ncbi:MAG TPA: hypothetical protein VNB90_07625 [Cytophagaceae bacterium]|jgi:hypothetical protein|nr:hypothetical protein [Cytophagaceae bacterium]